jgi:hypothetical protein
MSEMKKLFVIYWFAIEDCIEFCGFRFWVNKKVVCCFFIC